MSFFVDSLSSLKNKIDIIKWSAHSINSPLPNKIGILATNSRGLFIVNGLQLGALSDTMTETTTVTAAFVVSDVQVDFSFGLQRGQEGRNVVSGFEPQMFEIVEDGLVRCVYEGRGQSFAHSRDPYDQFDGRHFRCRPAYRS
jgi:hypothetical protein